MNHAKRCRDTIQCCRQSARNRSELTCNTCPLLVVVHSVGLGVFIPYGGSWWVVEASYVLQAANLRQAHLGWVVQIYNAAEPLPGLANPFLRLPLLGILKLKARDIVRYVVFLLCWLFGRYIAYLPPMK